MSVKSSLVKSTPILTKVSVEGLPALTFSKGYVSTLLFYKVTDTTYIVKDSDSGFFLLEGAFSDILEAYSLV